MRSLTLIVSLLFWIGIAQADTKTVHVEWEFGGIANSYHLYKDGLLACESFDKVNLVMDCELDLVPGDNIFTMTAVGPYGETPHSAPFTLVYTPPASTTPQIISVEIIR